MLNILKNKIPTDIKPNTWVGVDTEFFGMNSERLHRPSGVFACLTIALNDPDDTVLFIDKEELITPALTSIDKCVWCFQKAMFDITQLRRFVSERGKIEPRRRTGVCAKHQRRLALAIKRARFLALLPYTPAHISPRDIPVEETAPAEGKGAEANIST